MTNATVLACNADALRIVWSLGLRVEWRAALRCSIVVIVVEVAKSVVIPSADRVDEPRLVKLSQQLRQALLRRTVSLTPALVVYNLL